MNIILWVLQGALAFVYISGGVYKVLKAEALVNYIRGFPLMGWRAMGVVEVAAAIVMVVPVGVTGMPTSIALAATVLAVVTLSRAVVYARTSVKFVVANPLYWDLAMGLVAGLVAWQRWPVA